MARAHSWRHASEGGFAPERYGVAAVGQPDAKAYVERHHYSGTHVADRQRYGLYDPAAGTPELCGVAVLSVPSRGKRVLTGVFPRLEPNAESLELGRLVLADSVAANGESWFTAEVLRLAARTGIRGVVSYSDPIVRWAADGTRTMSGHWGCTYQALNAWQLGRSTARTHWVMPGGSFFSPRAMQKIRARERGHEYAERRLVAWGAPAPKAGQDPAEWLGIALREASRGRRFRHPGASGTHGRPAPRGHSAARS
jgi:hypothetical protein